MRNRYYSVLKSVQHFQYPQNLKRCEVFASLPTATFGYAIKVNKGTNVYLPCHFPPSSQVKANALWFKETGVGQRIQLHPGDGSTDEVERLEQLYPLDHDQTVVLREVLMEDAGSYTCESPENKKLSTVDILVEGKTQPYPPLIHVLLCYTDFCYP